MIPQDFIQTLLDRTDIVGIIERHVPLKKAGANYQARCPFHNEKSPSFTVSQTKQFYHCFGCGAHGTAITFLMEYSGLGFMDAVNDLAQRVGLTVPQDTAAHPIDDRLAQLETRLETASRSYRAHLKESSTAIGYLKQRGLNGETAARFALGYAPDAWQGLATTFTDYDHTELETVGLVIINEQGRRYDRFRDRVMFPIRNERGRLIGFGGRVIGDGTPKYLNSPETPLFHKGRELYGLHENRRGIQTRNQVVVVEGYMDVVMLAQHGIDNAVATLGTAVTPDQTALLLRRAETIIFAFDGDAAGRKAAWRALENSLSALQDGKSVRFLFLPDGEDPDSFVRQFGADAWQAQLQRAQPLSDFLLDSLSHEIDLRSSEGQVLLSKRATPYLEKLHNAPLLRQLLNNRLREITGLSEKAPRRQSMRHPPARPHPRTTLSAARILLQSLLHDPERLPRLPNLNLLSGPEADALRAVCDHLAAHPHTQTRDLTEAFRESPHAPSLFAALENIFNWDETYDAEADFIGTCTSIAQQDKRLVIQALAKKRPSEMTQDERQRLQNALTDFPGQTYASKDSSDV